MDDRIIHMVDKYNASTIYIYIYISPFFGDDLQWISSPRKGIYHNHDTQSRKRHILNINGFELQ